MDIKDIWIPEFSNKDLEVIGKHPWFSVKIHGENGDLICRYGTYTPTSLCYYPIEPKSTEAFQELDKFKESLLTKVALSAGLQFIDKGFKLGGVPSSPEANVLLLPVQNIVHGQACGIGYCKQLDCNIGFTARGKWMEDSDNFLLPKDFWDASWEAIQTGRYIGCEFGKEMPHVRAVVIDKRKEYRCNGFVYDIKEIFREKQVVIDEVQNA